MCKEQSDGIIHISEFIHSHVLLTLGEDKTKLQLPSGY